MSNQKFENYIFFFKLDHSDIFIRIDLVYMWFFFRGCSLHISLHPFFHWTNKNIFKNVWLCLEHSVSTYHSDNLYAAQISDCLMPHKWHIHKCEIIFFICFTLISCDCSSAISVSRTYNSVNCLRFKKIAANQLMEHIWVNVLNYGWHKETLLYTLCTIYTCI